MKELYEELNNKYIWAKNNRIKPSEEARSLEKHMPAFLAGDNRKIEEAFSKLPWGGWSNAWSKKLGDLKERIEKVGCSSVHSIRLKRKILPVLNNLSILRSDYERALDGEKAAFKESDNLVSESLNKCNKILLLDDIVEQEKELTITFDLTKGEVNHLKMDDSVDPETLVRTIGEKPDSKEVDVWNCYKYYKRGFCIQLFTPDNKKTKIWSAHIYLKDTVSMWDDDYYESFKGKIIPLTSKENRETIRQKFGDYYEDITIQPGTMQWRYQTSYGHINFVFDENGDLKIVSMFFN